MVRHPVGNVVEMVIHGLKYFVKKKTWNIIDVQERNIVIADRFLIFCARKNSPHCLNEGFVISQI